MFGLLKYRVKKEKELTYFFILIVWLSLPTHRLFAQETDPLQVSHDTLLPHSGKILEIRADDSEYQEGAYQISDFLDIMPDSSGSLTIEEVSSKAFENRFLAGESAELSQTHPEVEWFWIRLTIQSHLGQPETWLVNFAHPEVSLFTKEADGSFSIKRSGTYVPFSERYFQNSYGSAPLLPVYIPIDKTTTYFFKINTQEPYGKAARNIFSGLMTTQAYAYEKSFDYNIYMSFVLGIFLTVALYHLIFFFYNRVEAFLYFGLCTLSHFILIAYFSGFALIYIFKEYPVFNNDFLFYIAISGFVVFLTVFSSSYLQLKRFVPKWNLILILIVGGQVTFSIGMILMRLFFPSFYEDYASEFQRLYTPPIAVIMIFILLAAFRSFQKGHKPASTFLIAMGISIGQDIINVIGASKVIYVPEYIQGNNGSIVGMLMFAIVLGRQYKLLQEEKAQAEIAQREKQAESQRLKELDQFKTRFFANITHEFRTPLTIIQGLAKEIRENPRWKITEHTNLISQNSHKLLELINQLLDLSKLEAGKLEATYIQGDIIKYLNYLTELFSFPLF